MTGIDDPSVMYPWELIVIIREHQCGCGSHLLIGSRSFPWWGEEICSVWFVKPEWLGFAPRGSFYS